MATSEVLLQPGGGATDHGAPPRGTAGGRWEVKRHPKSWRELASLTWPLIMCTAMIGMHKEMDVQLFQPYFYTRVSCCGPGESPLPNHMRFGSHTVELSISKESCHCDVHASYPDVPYNASEPLVIDACAVPVLPKANPLWSHSRHCPNFLYVQLEAQKLTATWNVFAAAAALLCLPLGGRCADLYGRRLVWFWASAATTLAFCIFTVDGLFDLGDLPIYATALGVGAFECIEPVQWAMAIDLVPDPIDQARFFPLMAAVTSGGVASLVGEGIAYYVLGLYLDDYTPVWGLLSLLTFGVCLVVWFVLPETLQNARQWTNWAGFMRGFVTNEVETPETGRGTTGFAYGTLLWCRGGESGDDTSAEEQAAGGALIVSAPGRQSGEVIHATRRRILIITFTVSIVGIFFSKGRSQIQQAYMLNYLHMQQQDVVVMSTIGKATTVLATPIAIFVLPYIGPWLASVIAALGSVLNPMLFVLLGPASPYISVVVGAATTALGTPALQMYIASALRPDDQGKAQSSLNLFHAVFQQLGIVVYTAVFFGSSERMISGFVCQAVVGLGLLAMTVAYPRTLPPPPTVKSAAALHATVIV